MELLRKIYLDSCLPAGSAFYLPGSLRRARGMYVLNIDEFSIVVEPRDMKRDRFIDSMG